MVIAIKNIWRLFCYGLKRYHYENFIGIRKLFEQLALDLFNDHFTTDTGNPKIYNYT